MPYLFESELDYTVDNLSKRAYEGVVVSGGARFDPLTLLLIETLVTSIIGVVVQHYAEKCFDRIDPPRLQRPTMVDQAMLRLKVSSATAALRRKAATWPEGVDVGALARIGLYSLGRSMTAGDLDRFRARCGAL